MISQQLTQRQQLKILPQQIQLLNLFQLTDLELEQHIQTELENNPVLEEVRENDESTDNSQDGDNEWELNDSDDIPNYKLEYANYFSGEVLPEKPIVQEVNFRHHIIDLLRCQIKHSDDFKLATYLVDSLNSHGILETSLDEIAETYSFKENKWVEREELEHILHLIQQLDPPGIGARNIRECFLLQLNRLDVKDNLVKLATVLITDNYDALTAVDLEQIKINLGVDDEGLKEVLAFIAKLSIRPVSYTDQSEVTAEVIIPDFIITTEDEEVKVSLHKQRSHSLFLNTTWVSEMESRMQDKDKAGRQYLKSKKNAAEWFIAAIQERETNMLSIMKAIVQYQKPFFLSGDIMLLRPMILKDISAMVQLDISTVSRVTSNKYAATPFGNVLLKSLFSEGIKDNNGDVICSRVIRNALKDTIDAEDKKTPFTDYQLTAKLAQIGFKLARRTVSKYREILKIPAAQFRAIWSNK
jgi:RNA polymerase sigma-54 factor